MAEQGARRGSARHEDPALPSGEREHGPNCARAFRPRALQSCSLSPAFSPPIPHSTILSLPDAGRSRADVLFVVRVALIGRDRPLLLTYFLSEGT